MQDKDWMVADALDYELLKENAKANRNNMTEAESAFWQMAKGSGFGEKCRRQYIIGQYIVDFFFRKSMLIVEVDGGYHRPEPSKYFFEGDLQDQKLSGDLLMDFKNNDSTWINNLEQIDKDKQRQDWLEHQGYKVVRFTNEQILYDSDNVVKIIKQNLKSSF